VISETSARAVAALAIRSAIEQIVFRFDIRVPSFVAPARDLARIQSGAFSLN
jgi:hypothetical protein